MFCWETLSPGIHVDVTLTCTTYLNIVADQVHPFMATVFPNGRGLFQYAPCHTAKIVQEWFEEHDKVFKVLIWPPNSPDLNPIEHLWDVLDKQVQSIEHPPRNLQDLKDLLLTSWCQIPQHTFRGYYMYIETSRPRQEGDKARLLTPLFSVVPKKPYGNVANTPSYCFTLYYHMYGKHIGTLNVYLRQKSQTGEDSLVWTLSGSQGDHWKQARVNIHPTSSFQMILEGIRGSGIEGDIAIDDVAIEEGECRDPPPNSNLRSLAPSAAKHIWKLCITLLLVLGGQRR
ncbi:hypothetical protein PGIGA_G00019780 [Pangasianodon gigas]|uniref:Uncharacterized protein n=1 Tax=Pangasianodon gigas TaxID=30993 RepID=A0ACC5WUX2_PANGG|nr:hypothetical protein [Pangasianodon gigas]